MLAAGAAPSVEGGVIQYATKALNPPPPPPENTTYVICKAYIQALAKENIPPATFFFSERRQHQHGSRELGRLRNRPNSFRGRSPVDLEARRQVLSGMAEGPQREKKLLRGQAQASQLALHCGVSA